MNCHSNGENDDQQSSVARLGGFPLTFFEVLDSHRAHAYWSQPMFQHFQIVSGESNKGMGF